MPDVSVFFPQNFFLFLRPDKLVLYQFSAALWRTKALEQRKSTLRMITEVIVDVQKEFFEKGFLIFLIKLNKRFNFFCCR